jgi:octaprenyl-diphosphate synthase
MNLSSPITDDAAASTESLRSKKPIPAAIRAVQDLLHRDLEAVNAALRSELNSDVPLIGEIGDYLVQAGGKRIRPMLCLLSFQAAGGGSGGADPSALLAAIVEMIHTATLLHDDVVDESDTRRNRKTANALWGNAPSVLVGDFIYSRAFQMMVRLQDLQIMDILADTTNMIAEGEVMQLLHKRDASLSATQYFEVIKRKTAILFAASCRLGALAAGASSETQLRFGEFGMQLGMAFQIADDLLDYTGDAQSIGKNLGDDLAEGKTTLPLILAQLHGSTEQAAFIAESLRHGKRESFAEVVHILRETDALDQSFAQAKDYADSARAHLVEVPDSAAKAAMIELANYAVARER